MRGTSPPSSHSQPHTQSTAYIALRVGVLRASLSSTSPCRHNTHTHTLHTPSDGRSPFARRQHEAGLHSQPNQRSHGAILWAPRARCRGTSPRRVPKHTRCFGAALGRMLARGEELGRDCPLSWSRGACGMAIARGAVSQDEWSTGEVKTARVRNSESEYELMKVLNLKILSCLFSPCLSTL